ncbi:MAG: hypothetical protein H5U02_11490 [Clostridia bacterium]|nr:hypothetical protein [Clostridia bacterium]
MNSSPVRGHQYVRVYNLLQIKPDGQSYNLYAGGSGLNEDKNLWFKVNGQIPGTHTFLVYYKNDDGSFSWYQAGVKYAEPELGLNVPGTVFIGKDATVIATASNQNTDIVYPKVRFNITLTCPTATGDSLPLTVKDNIQGINTTFKTTDGGKTWTGYWGPEQGFTMTGAGGL